MRGYINYFMFNLNKESLLYSIHRDIVKKGIRVSFTPNYFYFRTITL